MFKIRHRMNEDKKNIIVYRVGSLGDTIMALPCFNKVRELYPTADITLLTNRPIAAKAAPAEAVLGSNFFFNRVLNYPIGTRNPFVVAALIKKIRSLNIDTAVNLTTVRSKISVNRDRWFFQAAGIKSLLAFPGPDDFGLINPTTGEYEWEAARLAKRFNSLSSINLDADHYWDLHLTDSEFNTADQALGDISPTSPIVAISVGTKVQAKDWGINNWTAFVKELRHTLPNCTLLMIGAIDEAEVSDSILKAWNGPGVNVCGRTSPRVSAAILKKACIFIGHDSGPMHLAACVGTPCVAIFSARNLPRQWYPRGDFNRILYHKTDCAGCGLDTCIIQQQKCIMSITVNEAIQAVNDVLKINVLNFQNKV